MIDRDPYITIEQVGQLGIGDRATIYRRIEDGVYAVKPSPDKSGNGRPETLVRVASLPEPAQVRYWAAVFDRTVAGSTTSAAAGQFDLAEYTEAARAEAVRRHAIVQEAQARIADGADPLMTIYSQLAAQHGDGQRTIERWIAAYRAAGVVGLLPKWGRQERGFRSLSPELQALIRNEYLVPQQPSVYAVHRRIEQVCAQFRLPAPSVDTVARFIRTIPEGVAVLKREGAQEYRKQCRPKVWRDPESVDVGEMWVGDHREMDVFIRLSDEPGAKIFRPWFTAWLDVRSRVCVGWHVALTPNSHGISLALHHGIMAFGVPQGPGLAGALYVDNGKDYKSHLLNGKTIDHGTVGIPDDAALIMAKGSLHPLGIEIIHATEYSPWQKPIEPWFGHTFPQWERTLPGWCGADNKHRPDKLKGELASGKLLTLTQFREQLAARLDEYHRTPHTGVGMGGATPLSIWEGRTIERPDARALHLMLMPHKAVKVRPQGIPAFGTKMHPRFYRHDEALALKIGEWVEIRYNPDDLSSVVVFQRNRFLCVATNADAQSFRPSLPDLAEAKKRIAVHRKAVERYADHHSALMNQDEVLRQVVNDSPRSPKVLDFPTPGLAATPDVQAVALRVQSVETAAFEQGAAALAQAQTHTDAAYPTGPHGRRPTIRHNHDVPTALLRRRAAPPERDDDTPSGPDRMLQRLIRTAGKS